MGVIITNIGLDGYIYQPGVQDDGYVSVIAQSGRTIRDDD